MGKVISNYEKKCLLEKIDYAIVEIANLMASGSNRELSLTLTKLQEAYMWAEKIEVSNE